MAESAISSVVQRLSNLLIQEVVVLKGVRQQVEWLRDELKSMQCFLEDADAKQEEDIMVKNWVSKIRDAAFHAEDIIETFVLEIEFQKQKGFVRRYAHVFRELIDRFKVGKEIESLRVELNDISRRRESYSIRRVGEGTTSIVRERLRQLRRSSPRGLGENDLVGLKKDTTRLVARLLQKENRLSVISIVGIGGLGKTTLAKRVYNHQDVRDHFSCHAWVYVSQECRPKDILQEIIREVTSPTELQWIIENSQDQELERRVYEKLEKLSYLVVLDDIWNREDWDVLSRAFPNTNNGSRVLLTTRKRDVALYADARSIPYELPLLSEEDSWELFSRKAFIDEVETKCPLELEEVAKEIVEKCAGLPLAIVVIGGLLSRKRSVREWGRVLNNIDLHFARPQNGVLPVFSLSYSDLPHYLKPCFLHLGIFPEDYVISTRKLFQLWIAEGLIPQGEESMETIAEDYLNELTDRNMVQVVRMSSNKRTKECQLHDVLRDLSILKAKEEIFLEIHGTKDLSPAKKSRHQAIYSNFDRYFHLKPFVPRLHSLLFFNSDEWKCSKKSAQFICASFKLLRVLDLENLHLDCLPSDIGQLINLRYLGLRNTKITTLPSSMKYLRSLETLDLSGNVSLHKIPNVISKMENLRHLYMKPLRCDGQLKIDSLRHLQTLLVVHVDNWGQNNSENMKSLLKLGVAVSSASDVGKFFDSIAKLEQLSSLYLVSDDFNEHIPFFSLSGLHCLTKLRMKGRITLQPGLYEFPTNLTQLTLEPFGLNQCFMSLLNELPRLSVLKLRHPVYYGNQLTISANWFPQLQFLELLGMKGPDELIIEKGAMPRLRHCRIIRCWELKIFCSGSVLNAFHEAEIDETPLQIIEASSGVDISKCSPSVVGYQ